MADEKWRSSVRGRLGQLAKGAGLQRADAAELRDILGDDLCERWGIAGDDETEAVRRKIAAQLEGLIQRFVKDSERLLILACFRVFNKLPVLPNGWSDEAKQSLDQRRRESVVLVPEDKEPPSERTVRRRFDAFLNNAAAYLERDQPEPDRSRLRYATIAAAVFATASASVGATIFVAHLVSGHDQPRSAPDTTPKTAPVSSLPVLLENVSPLTSDSGLSFVLPGKLDMTPTELADFGNNLAGNPETFASWFTEHKGVSLGNSTMHLTLTGNIRGEAVRITDINLFKQCHEPTGGGTIFTEPGQGEPSDIPMGFDLDSPKPVAQDEGFSSQTGHGALLPTKFFDSHTISLAYGEQETLRVDMHGSTECSFTFQLVIATPSGTLTEKIDNNGQPFEITAMTQNSNSNIPFAKYQAAYVNMVAYGDAEWKKVDPRSFSFPSLP